MKLIRRIGMYAVVGVMVAMMSVTSSIATAQSYDPDQDLRKPTVFEKRVEKLGLGISNVLFGWTEIPVAWDQKMKQGKPLTYLLTTAPVVGLVRGVMRTGTGVYEIVTFTEDLQENNYEGILEPEYLF